MRTNFIAFWDEETNEYKWYDKPEAAKGGRPIEVSVNGSKPVICVFTGDVIVRKDGESAEVYAPLSPKSYIRKSKYFAFDPAKVSGIPKMPPAPVDPEYMKRRHKLLEERRNSNEAWEKRSINRKRTQ